MALPPSDDREPNSPSDDRLLATNDPWRWALPAILVMSVVVRLVYSLGIARGLLHIQPELQSTDLYHDIARTLLDGNGYRYSADKPLTASRPPGYPLFLLAIFSVAGVNYVWVQVAQALLGAVGCWLLFLLGRWVHSSKLGLAAAGLYAIYPNSIEYSARLYSENVFFPVFLAFAYLLCRASYKGSVRHGVAAGAAWGASLLTRGTLLALPLALPIGIALSRTHRSPASRWVRWVVPSLLAASLVVAPWAARNYALTGAFVPVSTWGWPPIYFGTQVAKGMTRWVDSLSEDAAATQHLEDLFAGQSQNGDTDSSPTFIEVRFDRFAKTQTLAEWGSDPVGVAERAAMGLCYTWFYTFGSKLRLFSLAVHLPLFVLFVLGVVGMARRYRESFVRAWPALGLILYVNVFQAVAYPHVRYMTPAIVLSFLFSGLPLIELGQRMFRWGQPSVSSRR
jgi:4-amino-4-deoxy-L-arabinose transferase-like glycosyltransferase